LQLGGGSRVRGQLAHGDAHDASRTCDRNTQRRAAVARPRDAAESPAAFLRGRVRPGGEPNRACVRPVPTRPLSARRVALLTFAVQAELYDRFMGRYSTPLAPKLADCAGVRAGQRVLDVGCGPGALTEELVARLGPESVAAVDPSEPFVAAARERHPGVDVQQAGAEELPFPDAAFDAALAQLVIHFMADAPAGVAEMKRVTRDGGVVAACVWDHGGGHGPLSLFWEAARELEPDTDDESRLLGASEGDPGRVVWLTGHR